MNQLMIFEGVQVEVLEVAGRVLFNPYHCGECLELGESAVRMAIGKMSDKQVVKLKNSDVKDIDIRKLNNAGENFLTESGVYKLIFKSNKPDAEKFQDWVTDEVLPSIRQKGHYTSNNEKAKTNAVADGISGITSPATLELMQTMLNDQKILLEANKKLELENQVMQPKAKGYDELIDSKGDLDFKDFVKSVDGLTIGRNLFMGILRDKKILLSNNTPYQTYIERGYFRVIQVSNGFHSSPKTLVTKKGMDWLVKKCREWDLI